MRGPGLFESAWQLFMASGGKIVYASRCRRPRFESHLMEKPQKKDPQTSQCKSATSISPIFWFNCLSAGGAGTLPAEAVPEACKKTGGHYRQFFNLSFYLHEKPVLCLRNLSLMQVKYRGPLPPFFCFAFLLFFVEFLLNRPQRNASKLFSRGLQICRKLKKNHQKSIQNAPKIRPGRPSGQTRAPSCSSRSYKKLTC